MLTEILGFILIIFLFIRHSLINEFTGKCMAGLC